MPRVCNREGCGQRLVGKNGTPDYHRHFCGPECLRADKRERLQVRREKLKKVRCPVCGWKQGETQSSDNRVKFHKTPRCDELSAGKGAGHEREAELPERL